MKTLSKEEVRTLVELLNRCELGNLPDPVFVAVARVAVYPAIELVALREKDDRLEVFLAKRRSDDLVWPSMTHLPGTVLRPTDTSFADALKRLFDDEFDGIEPPNPTFIGAHFSRSKRGTGIGFNYVMRLENDLAGGQFYDVEALPATFDPAQQQILDRAIASYKDLYIEAKPDVNSPIQR